MDKKQQHEQQQEQPKHPWRRPAVERLQVSVDTKRGSGADWDAGPGPVPEPDQIFGGG